MNLGLKTYPTYKDSGVPWLGDVPEHWKTQRAKWLFQKMERPACEADEVVTCFRDGMVTLRKNRRVRGFTESLKEIGYQGIRRGDLVIHAMDAFAGAVGVSDSDGKGTPVYSVCQPTRGANAYYYAFTIREMARSQWILALAKGIRERSTDFRYSDFVSQPVPLPPLDEQDSIVRYLDHADRLIRRYIHAKQKLIMLLNEQKQAIIQQAVTRGLDPNVQLKASGVEWLGDRPEHWETKRLKTIASIRYGLGQPPRESEAGLPLIRATNVDHGRILEKNLVRVDPVDVPKNRNAFLTPGEIIVVRSGAYTADSAIIPKEYEGAVTGYDMVVSVRRARADFVALALLSPYVRDNQLVIASMRSAQPHLNAEELGVAIILLPPETEQARIVAWVAGESAKIDVAIDHAQHEITLVREYRTRLIADVVTGKVDVREAAAHLPNALSDEAALEQIDAEVDDTEADELIGERFDPEAEEAQA